MASGRSLNPRLQLGKVSASLSALVLLQILIPRSSILGRQYVLVRKHVLLLPASWPTAYRKKADAPRTTMLKGAKYHTTPRLILTMSAVGVNLKKAWVDCLQPEDILFFLVLYC